MASLSASVVRIGDAKDAFHASVAVGTCPAFERVGLGYRLT
jgi:hypothetical protein